MSDSSDEEESEEEYDDDDDDEEDEMSSDYDGEDPWGDIVPPIPAAEHANAGTDADPNPPSFSRTTPSEERVDASEAVCAWFWF